MDRITITEVADLRTKWQVRGLVAGPALPSERMRLGDGCWIGPVSDNQARRLIDQAARRFTNIDAIESAFEGADTFSVELPMTAIVRSRHSLSIVVKAHDIGDAMDAAQEEASRRLAALALLVATQGYRFYPSVAHRMLGSGAIDTGNYGASGLGAGTVYERGTLRPVAMDRAKTLLALEVDDKVFGRAFGFLRAAWRLRELPLDDPAVKKAVLSNCHLSLEAISDAVTKEWRQQNKTKNATNQARIVDRLQETLNHTEDDHRKVAASRSRTYSEPPRASYKPSAS